MKMDAFISLLWFLSFPIHFSSQKGCVLADCTLLFFWSKLPDCTLAKQKCMHVPIMESMVLHFCFCFCKRSNGRGEMCIVIQMYRCWQKKKTLQWAETCTNYQLLSADEYCEKYDIFAVNNKALIPQKKWEP